LYVIKELLVPKVFGIGSDNWGATSLDLHTLTYHFIQLVGTLNAYTQTIID
jgi:hypothetical protein